jgi:hypothetical protein
LTGNEPEKMIRASMSLLLHQLKQRDTAQAAEEKFQQMHSIAQNVDKNNQPDSISYKQAVKRALKKHKSKDGKRLAST